MSDISVSVGLDTSNALKNSKDYIKSLNDVIKISEDLRKQTALLNRSLGSQSKSLNTVAKNQEKYTKSLNKTDTALNRTAGRLAKVSGQVSGLSDKVSQAVNRQNKLVTVSDRVSGAADRQSRALKNNANGWGALGRAVKLYLGLNFAKSIITTNNQLIGLNSALKVVTGSTSGAERAMSFIKKTAEELGLDVLALGQSYKQLTAAAKGANFPLEESDKIFRAIASTSRALNLSTEDTKGAIRALSQAMSKGTVQAEELRGQLGERIPGAFGLAARSMGVTTKELGKMLENGQVLARDMLPKLADELVRAFPAGADATDNMAANIARMKNAFVELAGVLGQGGLNEAVKNLTKDIATFARSDEAIELATSLGKALEVVGDAAGFLVRNWKLLVAAIAGKAILGGIASIAALATSIGAFSVSTGIATGAVRIFGAALKAAIPLIGAVILAAEGLVFLANTEFGEEFLDRAFGTDEEIMSKAEALGIFKKQIKTLFEDNAPATKIVDNIQDITNATMELGANFNNLGSADARKVIDDISASMQVLKDRIQVTTFGALREDLDGMSIAQQNALPSLVLFNRQGHEGEAAFQAAQNSIIGYKNTLEILGVALTEAQEQQRLFKERADLSEKLNKTVKSFEKLTAKLLPADQSLTKLMKTMLKTNKLSDEQTKRLKKAAAAYNKLKKAIDDQKKAEKAAQKLAANRAKDSDFIDSLELEFSLLKATAEQRMIMTNLQALSADATLEETLAVTELTSAIFKKNKAMKEAEEQQKSDNKFLEGIEKSIEATEKLGDSWLTVGDNLEDVFGNIIDQVNAMSIQDRKFTKQQLENKKEIDRLSGDSFKDNIEAQDKLKQLTSAQGALEDKNTAAKLGNLAAITSATSQMFEEGSSGARSMMIVSKALAVAQAVTAIATQGLGDPYTAFARIAAMISTMKSLGIAVSGSAGKDPTERRQETQGTGTVLGDESAKADSLVKAFERLEDIDLDQFLELRNIFKEMQDLNRNIAGFSAGVVRSFGDFSDGKGFSNTGVGTTQNQSAISTLLSNVLAPIDDILGGFVGALFDSFFGSKKKKLIDSGIQFLGQTFGDIISGGIDAVAFADFKTKKKKFFGLSSSTSYSTQTQSLESEASNQLTAIFLGMGSSITSALDVLGISAVNSLESFVVDIGKVSLEGLTGEEIQAELEAVFSAQGDLMAQHVLPSLVNFQKIGEGLFETLLRVAQETAIFEQGLKLIGVGLGQFSDVSGEEFLNMSQAAIEAAGGIDAYKEAVQKFSTEVLSSTNILALAASNAQQLSEVELGDIGFTIAEMPDLAAFREAFDAIKDTLSPQEIVEWVQAGNALADLGNALAAFEETIADMLKPFQDLREGISNIIEDITGDLRTQLDLNKRLSKARSGVADTVGSSGNVNLDGDLDEQLEALTELRDAIVDNHDFQMSILDAERDALQDLLDTALQLQANVESFLSSVSDSMTSLEEMAPDFDEAATRAQELERLQEEVLSKVLISREAELKLLDKLHSAIMANFEAQKKQVQSEFAERRSLLEDEMNLRRELASEDFGARRDEANSRLDSLNELAELQEQITDTQLEQAEEVLDAWSTVASDINNFLNELSLSENSPLTNKERVDFAQSRFEELLAKAQGGDVEAAQSLTGASEAYLEEARSFFASSSDFTDIFNLVQAGLGGVETLANSIADEAALTIGEATIVGSLDSVVDQIAVLTETLGPLSQQEIAAQIVAQQLLIEQIAVEEASALATIAADEQALLTELSEQEQAALETLRLETITQLQSLEARAEELNALISDDILTYQDAILVIEDKADQLREQTVTELQGLNTLISELEFAREESARLEFETLIAANTANTDRIVEAITSGGTVDDSGDGSTGGGSGGGSGGGGSTGDNEQNFNEQNAPIMEEMSKALNSIDNTLRGGGGGAVLQFPPDKITSI